MTIERILKTLEELSEAIGVSGFESPPRDLIREEIKDLVDKVWVDPLGNLLAIRKGETKHPRILLDAHVDEIGFIITHVDKRGFLRIAPLGGWDPRTLPGQRVIIQPHRIAQRKEYPPPVFGVITAMPPHLTSAEQRRKVIPIEELLVDIGVTSRDEAKERGVVMGVPLTVWQPFMKLSDDSLTGKAFDDRVGCTILIEILRRLEEAKDKRATVVFNFSMAEEVGARGARTGAYTLEPDVALALECTTAADIPGVPEHKSPTRLGEGPAITLADRSLIAHPKVVSTLKRVGEKQKIRHQIKKPIITGGTDAGPIHVSRGGVPSGVVSVPSRNIHSAVSVIRLSDVVAAIDLVQGFVKTWKD